MIQNLSQPPQQYLADQQTESRLPLSTQTIAEWEHPEIEEFELCFEVTAYIYHWE